MATIAETFALALNCHRAGDLAQAEQLCRQILQVAAHLADPWHLLGVVEYQTGRSDMAVQSLRQAVALDPRRAALHSNLGLAYQAVGQLEEAVASFRHALQLQPDLADAHHNLADALRVHGRLDEAEAHCWQALHFRPDFPEAYNTRGTVLLDQSKPEEAAQCFQYALQLCPGLPQVHNNLGIALEQMDKLDDAVTSYRKALHLKPDFAEALNNLGVALERQGNLDEAVRCYREALRLKPAYAEALNSLGIALDQQNQLDEAMHCFQQALRLKPNYPSAHWNRAMLCLRCGDFTQGWQEYEWRWQTKGFPRYSWPQPRWDGLPLGGRTILLVAEQGLGDTLQFIRYVALVGKQGGRVLVMCQAPLVRLLASMPGIDGVLAHGAQLPAFDVYAPLLSLPGIFHAAGNSIPADVPYLHPDADLVERWRGELGRGIDSQLGGGDGPRSVPAPLGGLKVGIAWQGSPTFRGDRQRSIPLARFARLAQCTGVNLISLQHGPGTEQLNGLAGKFLVLDVGSRLVDFMDTAAVVKNLDLVISCDTAVAHLAGALARPVWIALPLVPDWRWLLRRVDSPWYPTMRLFRQERQGDWEGVFDRMAEELQALVALE